jgi:hypothetical protein
VPFAWKRRRSDSGIAGIEGRPNARRDGPFDRLRAGRTEGLRMGNYRGLVVADRTESDKWDWFRNCDGCTGVSEKY